MKQLPDDCPITALKLDARPFNALIRRDIETIGRLCEMTESDLLTFFKERDLENVRRRLAENGRVLGDVNSAGE